MQDINVAVIGLGGIAQLIHLPILTKLNSVNLAAVSENNKTKLNSIAEKFNIRSKYSSYEELLKDDKIDAVIIATPTNTHHEIALKCLEAGKHVLIEKPIARNFAEAEEIHQMATKVNKIAMVGMNLRFRPDAMLLKSLIKSGELGDIFYLKCSWVRKQSSSEGWFLSKSQSGGGVLIDLGILLLDLGMWLIDFPKIKSISVQKFCHNIKNVEDSAVAFIRLENECIINLEVSWSLHSDKDSFFLATHGLNGTAHLNPLRAYKRVGANRIDYTPASTTNSKDLFKKSYENELKHFLGAIRGSFDVMSSSGEALSRMKLLDAIYKSADLGREIEFEE